jgi:hypothetical protein
MPTINYTNPPGREVAELKHKSAQVLLDHLHHTVWVFPPKCAQTALRKWVGKSNPGVISPVPFVNARTMINRHHYRLVMSVRNPASRIVSAWKNKWPQLSLREVVMTACSRTDYALDLHLQSQMYLLRCLERTVPDIALRVGPELGAMCQALPWMQDSPAKENVSGSRLDDFVALPTEVTDLFYERFADDYSLWRWAGGES